MPEDGSWKTWSLSVVEFGPEDFVNVFEKSVKFWVSIIYDKYTTILCFGEKSSRT